MSYYVRDKIIGREDYCLFSEWLLRSGVGEAYVFNGGWVDDELGNIAPHIKFEREEDAIAYVLTYGGGYSTSLPTKD